MTIVPADVERVFRDSGALQEGHFILASGRHASLYLEKFQVLQHPSETERRSWSTDPAERRASTYRSRPSGGSTSPRIRRPSVRSARRGSRRCIPAPLLLQ